MKRASETPRFLFSKTLTSLFLILFVLPPSLLHAATYAHDTPLLFQWVGASGSVNHYNVYLSVDNQPFQEVAAVSSPSCTISVQDGRTYQVQVDAENEQGETGLVSDASESVVVFLNGSAADTDGDGMPNSWEDQYGFNSVNPADGTTDPDFDGLINRNEYVAGTRPNLADTDGDGVKDGAEVQAGMNPTNPADNVPVANAGNNQELDPTVVTLDGSASLDPNHDPLTYQWTQTGGAQVTLSDPKAVRPTFLGKQRDTYRFQLVVSDGRVNSQPDDVTVTIRNVAPTADAGADRVVDGGALVVLDGSGSRDPNGDVLSYTWTQVGGPVVSLNGARTQAASFSAVNSGVYRFRLVVHDGLVGSVADEVQVVVNAANQVPTADAGDDLTADVNEQVILDGSGSSDPDGDVLQFAWTSADGFPQVSLNGAGTEQASFVPSQSGVYRFELAVSDGQDWSPADEVTVTVLDGNQPPVALILDVDPVEVGTWVTLNGAGSFDPDGEPITCLWTQREGPQVAVEGYESIITGFYPTTEGILKFELVVNDGEMNSQPMWVEIVVNGRNQVPVADAGQNQEALVGQRVCLNGSGSHDPDLEDVILFSWSQVDGPMTTLQGADTGTPCFTPENSGVYAFQLSVFDGELKSTADDVLVTVELKENQAPVAVPGPHQAVLPGTKVLLDGTGSYDLDGEIVEYVWEQSYGMAVSKLIPGPVSGSKLTVTSTKEGYFAFSLKVFDGELWSEKTNVVIWVTKTPPANCSMLGTGSRRANPSDILFVATLFLPAMGMVCYRKRRARRESRNAVNS